MNLKYLQDNLKVLVVDADVCTSKGFTYEQVLTSMYNDLLSEEEANLFMRQEYIDDMYLIKDLYNKLNK